MATSRSLQSVNLLKQRFLFNASRSFLKKNHPHLLVYLFFETQNGIHMKMLLNSSFAMTRKGRRISPSHLSCDLTEDETRGIPKNEVLFARYSSLSFFFISLSPRKSYLTVNLTIKSQFVASTWLLNPLEEST